MTGEGKTLLLRFEEEASFPGDDGSVGRRGDGGCEGFEGLMKDEIDAAECVCRWREPWWPALDELPNDAEDEAGEGASNCEGG